MYCGRFVGPSHTAHGWSPCFIKITHARWIKIEPFVLAVYTHTHTHTHTHNGPDMGHTTDHRFVPSKSNLRRLPEKNEYLAWKEPDDNDKWCERQNIRPCSISLASWHQRDEKLGSRRGRMSSEVKNCTKSQKWDSLNSRNCLLWSRQWPRKYVMGQAAKHLVFWHFLT